jgi:hypothetical protein
VDYHPVSEIKRKFHLKPATKSLPSRLNTSQEQFIPLLLLAALLTGCSREPRSAAVLSKQDTGVGAGFSPQILAVTPGAVPFSDNKVTVGTFHVTHKIGTPGLVKTAHLELRTNAVVSATMDVPTASFGEADFKGNKTIVIGPAVRLRVQCPNGESNWLAVGALRPPASSAQSRIENITPDSIESPNALEMSTGGVDSPVHISLWGFGFQPECKVSYSVNDGEPAEADRAFQGERLIIVDVRRRPLYPFSCSHNRYLELDLVLDGKGSVIAKADTRGIPATGS